MTNPASQQAQRPTTPLGLASGKIPPQNVEAEQYLLGAILLDNEAMNRVIEVLSLEDFYRDSHRVIFRAMLDLFERNETIDLVTLQNYLMNQGLMDRVGGAACLVSLSEQGLTAGNGGS